MRIGIDVHAAEQDGSGNCSYIRGLVRALLGIESGHEFILYATDTGHPFYETVPRRPNVRIRRLAVRNPAVRIPFSLGPATHRDTLDVLHVQYVAPPFHRGRLVATIHDLGFLRVPGSFPRTFVWRSRILVRRTARRAARIITGSEFSRRDIVRTYGVEESKVEAIPNGVASALYERADPDRAARTLAALGIRKPYILFVGRLNPRKNLPTLGRAFRRLKTEHGIPHQLVIAGREDHATAKTLARIGDLESPDLVLPGFVPDEDLPALYQNAEMFVFPSLFEGAGLPVIEAMAAGTPVITSETSALNETAGGAALLIDPEDEAALASAIFRLTEDSILREALWRKGRSRAAAFTWEAAARRVLRVYEEAAAGRAARKG